MPISARAPDFIGIGAKKAATSWLAQCLSEHPDVCLPAGKELHFFSHAERFALGNAWYNEQFSECDAHAVRGEFSTSYLRNPSAARRIAEAVPNAKIIVSLRNPVDRAISHIQHWIAKGALNDTTSVADAIEAYPGVIEEGKYAQQLRTYLDCFPRKQIHIVLVDDIRNDPHLELQKLFAFIGVDSAYTPPSLHRSYNTSAYRRSRLFQFRRAVYLSLRKSQIGKRVLKAGKAIGVNTLLNNMMRSRSKFTVSAQERKELYTAFADDIAELERILDRDLSLWEPMENV